MSCFECHTEDGDRHLDGCAYNYESWMKGPTPWPFKVLGGLFILAAGMCFIYAIGAAISAQ